MDYNLYKEVRFNQYCDKCVNFEKGEEEDPCHDCLQNPSNEYSRKPVYFDPREGYEDWVAPQPGGDQIVDSGSGRL